MEAFFLLYLVANIHCQLRRNISRETTTNNEDYKLKMKKQEKIIDRLRNFI